MINKIKNQMTYTKMIYHSIMIHAYEEHWKKGRFPEVCFKKIVEHFMKMLECYKDLLKEGVVQESPKIIESLKHLEKICNR